MYLSQDLSSYYVTLIKLNMMRMIVISAIFILCIAHRVSFASSLEVRLVSGRDDYQGRVEVRHDGVWGTVCDDDWNLQDATVVCRMLGFQGASEAYGYAKFGEGSGSIVLDNVNCTGLESDLGDCSHNGFEVHNCRHVEDAGVNCHAPDLQVRLVDGQSALEGRVEVLYDGSWGTICDDGWSLRDAWVVCRMLGFPVALGAPSSAAYGQGSGDIILDDVACLGVEDNLAECSHLGYRVNNCGHSEDAGVVCSVTVEDLQVRLVDGPTALEGRVEVFHDGSWGTLCDDGWGLNDARVVCRMLGFPVALSAPTSAAYGEGSGDIVLSNVACLGTEDNLARCSHLGYGVHICSHSEDAGAVCSVTRTATAEEDLQVRLVDGQSSLEGRVEVLYDGSWGTICDDGWGLNDARVVCRMLGFQAALSAPSGAAFGEGSGNIVLDDVACLGKEDNLNGCSHGGYGVNNCGHSEDASVVCSVQEDFEVRLVAGRHANEGRVEVFFNGTWGTLCGAGWGLQEADVVCRWLGFSQASYALQNAAFGEGVGEIFLKGISCLGFEESLLACAFIDFKATNCRHSQDAGVMCKDADAVKTVDCATRVSSAGSGSNNPSVSSHNTRNGSSGLNPNNLSLTSNDIRSGFTASTIALGAILAASYAVFLTICLYMWRRLKNPKRMLDEDKDQYEQLDLDQARGTGSPQDASARISTAKTTSSKESHGKGQPDDLQYMGLELPEGPVGDGHVYSDLSFTKGNDQPATGRKYKAPLKPPLKNPIGSKPTKAGPFMTPGKNFYTDVSPQDPIYGNC